LLTAWLPLLIEGLGEESAATPHHVITWRRPISTASAGADEVASIHPGNANDQHKAQMLRDDEVEEPATAEQIERPKTCPMQ
jgi:hypothetical protein